MNRRGVLNAALALAMFGVPHWSAARRVVPPPPWSHGMLPLYCLAYIDPENPAHQGQEGSIARYPVSIVPQDVRPRHLRLRDRLRALNPRQRIFAYQMTLDENGLRGPGHEHVRRLRNAWLTLPGGIVPTIRKPSGTLQARRLYDPRNPDFREVFVEACAGLINHHGFDGLFLDNCTIYARYAIIPSIGHELREALQTLILELRTALPDTVIIGNSRHNWAGLNGEMNEGRPDDVAAEAAVFAGHVAPRMEMFYYYMKAETDVVAAAAHFRLALHHRMFFGTGVNAQTIRWHDFFDDVLAEESARWQQTDGLS